MRQPQASFSTTNAHNMKPQGPVSKLKEKAKVRFSRGKPDSDRSETGNGAVGPASARPHPTTHDLGVKGGSVNPRDGESGSM